MNVPDDIMSWFESETRDIVKEELARATGDVNRFPEQKALVIKARKDALVGHTEPGGHVRVEVFVGETKKLIGFAAIVENEVAVHIQAGEEYETIEHLVKRGVIKSFSITFNGEPPATTS